MSKCLKFNNAATSKTLLLYLFIFCFYPVIVLTAVLKNNVDLNGFLYIFCNFIKLFLVQYYSLVCSVRPPLDRSIIFGSVQSELPVTTASVQWSFSNLKVIKTQFRNRCGERRFSDLLLFIERNITTDHNEVININKLMAKRILLWCHQSNSWKQLIVKMLIVPCFYYRCVWEINI